MVSEDLRKSGIEVMGDTPWATHFCQFYQSKEDLLDTLVPYFRAGLEYNEFCFWVTAAPLSVDDALEALSRNVPDLKKYSEAHQIEVVPHDGWYVIDGVFEMDRVLRGWIEKHDQALKRGFDGLRLTGNTSWLEKKDWMNFKEYEATITNVIGRYRMLALCTYSLDACDANEILDVIENHESAIIKRDGKWQLIENSVCKKAQEALISSEEKYQSLYSAMSEGVALHEIIYDSEGNAVDYVLTDVNPSFESITGLTKEKAIGRKASELYGTGEAPYLDIYSKVAATGESQSFETYFPPMQKHFHISSSSGRKGTFANVFSDLTKRKKAEEALKKSEERYERSAATVPGVLYDYKRHPDGSRQFLYLSPRCPDVFEVDASAMLSDSQLFWQMVHPDDLLRLQQSGDAVMKDGGMFSTEVRIKTASGKMKWIQMSAAPNPAPPGEPPLWSGVILDITERKKVEEEIQKARDELEERVFQRTKELRQANDELMKEIDVRSKAENELHLFAGILKLLNVGNERKKMLNDTLKQIQEYTDLECAAIRLLEAEDFPYYTFCGFSEEFIVCEQFLCARDLDNVIIRDSEGNPCLECLCGHIIMGRTDPSFPFFTEEGSFWTNSTTELIASPDIADLKVPLRNRCNREGYESVALIPLRTGNETVGLLQFNDHRRGLFTADLIRFLEQIALSIGTAVKRLRTEEALQENESRLRLLLDQLPCMVWTTDLDLKITKAAGAGLPTAQIATEQMVGKRVSEIFGGENQNAFPVKNHRLALKGEASSCEVNLWGRTFLSHVEPLYDRQGKITGAISLGIDITERKQLETDLLSSNKDLQQFAYITSHDLQEPLRMISSYLQLIEQGYKGKLDDEADEYINFAVDGAKRMQEMILGLLEYSRIESRGAPLEPVDMAKVLQLVNANLSLTLVESNGRVTCDPLPTVIADGTQMIQLFQNLIGNALKFHSKEPPLVHVSASMAGDSWIFSVHDNGRGIEERYFERIFTIFQRLHSRREYPGSGIGLSICKRIIERHEGHIWVESTPGKGSTFYFTIPARNQNSQTQ